MSEAAIKRHQDMYKSRTPPWKETYRKRCLDRLRGSREKLMTRFRKIDMNNEPTTDDTFIKDLMTEEWKSLQREQTDIDFEGDVNGVDKMLSLFEDIQEELRREELRLLQEHEKYEESLQQEEVVLSSAIEKLSTDEVICPICQKSVLMMNQNIIFCRCGMRINTEQDCISLGDVKVQLESAISQHNSSCSYNPVFKVMSEFGPQHLLMACQACDFMYIII
ncbi:RPA-interacting protein A isoform X2 [Patella vulgata]|nr:RPA-interacting protein A isoform X2 [Patella vulgata]XP_050408442.1 RPA-interacting protein A isoform X2 [Patella vulgata]XP_050408444.1 RPA-interacting protein A isoform X2 [Patella vulgata]XP_050408445.1 RPA-interacting protein A isoform X2 [Patella vulgata]XP_050408446.1 RPA-interacting protein A isoform X2 [Patella vulgata]